MGRRSGADAFVWLLLLWAVARSSQAAPPPKPPTPATPPRGKRLTLAELRDLAAGVGVLDARTAAAIAMAESGGDPRVIGDNGTSFGLWQVHKPAHPEETGDLLDATENARAMARISRRGKDWSPWSTWWKDANKREGPGEGPFLAYL